MSQPPALLRFRLSLVSLFVHLFDTRACHKLVTTEQSTGVFILYSYADDGSDSDNDDDNS